MAIGARIKFFRNLRGMTQKSFGELLGFRGRTADVRVAQYESEVRVPKEELIERMAGALDVSPLAINVPDIDTYYGLMHTLFAVEDMYGLQAKSVDGKICLAVDRDHKDYIAMYQMLSAWQKQSEKWKNGEITKEEYDHWRYNYPKYNAFKPDRDNEAYLKEDVEKMLQKRAEINEK